MTHPPFYTKTLPINTIPQPHGKTTAVILAMCQAQQRADQSY